MSDQKLEQDVVDVLRGIARDTQREGTCTTMHGTYAVWRGVREAGFAEPHNIPRLGAYGVRLTAAGQEALAGHERALMAEHEAMLAYFKKKEEA